jgi:cytochrome c peroxidase
MSKTETTAEGPVIDAEGPVVGSEDTNVEDPAAETDCAVVGSEDTVVHTAPAKVTVVHRAKAIVRAHGRMIAACGLSALFGMVLVWLYPTSEPIEEAVVEPEPIYYAATHHRDEPIDPIVPFSDLEKEVVKLGKRLFHDKKLSGNGKVACNTCHDLNEGGQDGLPLAVSVNQSKLNRNTPTILNAALSFVKYWDGRVETMEEQLDEHIDAGVLDSDWERVVKVVTQDPLYNRSFQAYMGSEPSKDLVSKAFVAYERSLLTVDSRFDQWLQGKINSLTSEEIGGYVLFKQHNCITCHQGDGVGGKMLQPLAKLEAHFTAAGSPVPAGMVIRVPSLRNVELTAPYFHDGSVETLESAIEIMLRSHAGVEPNIAEVDRISAFLRTLTGQLHSR